MPLLPALVIAGALLVALVTAIATGELLVFVVVVPIVAVYALADRRLQRSERGDEKLSPVRPRD